MRKAFWTLVAVLETVVAFVLARPAALNAIKIANTRKEVLDPNFAYFMGMLFGDAIRLVPAALLFGHAAWIARKFIFSKRSQDVGLAQ